MCACLCVGMGVCVGGGVCVCGWERGCVGMCVCARNLGINRKGLQRLRKGKHLERK